MSRDTHPTRPPREESRGTARLVACIALMAAGGMFLHTLDELGLPGPILLGSHLATSPVHGLSEGGAVGLLLASQPASLALSEGMPAPSAASLAAAHDLMATEPADPAHPMELGDTGAPADTGAPLDALLASASAAADRGDWDPAGQLWVRSDDPELREDALQIVLSTATTDWDDGYRGNFLRALTPSALRLGRTRRVLPSVTLAQGILESGWGRSGLAKHHHNLFGIKAGRSSKAVQLDTHEHVDGAMQPTNKRFRTFESWDESLSHHARLVGADPRYAAAQAHWQDAPAFIAALAPVYASHPDYASTLLSLIRHHRLDRFDTLVVEAVMADGAREDAPRG